MDAARWQHIQELFHQAVKLEDAARREFLDEVCAGDGALRDEIESLIAVDSGATGFLGAPGAIVEDAGGDKHLGKRIGPYRLARCLGEGGMGMVYLAERADGEFEHKVAIKLMRSPWLGPQLLQRFITERQILAQLDHPNIARLLDGGTTALGQPYLVMEYVEGRPINDYCAEHRLSTRRRLELFLQICEAVAHAHRQLVVHRDLKPANILVASKADDRPAMLGRQVKLLDFGIAKLLAAAPDAPALTVVGGQVLTPEYASPEQVRGEPVSTASDVYSLGILLYELLAGVSPYRFDTKTPHEIERVVCTTPPTRPSAVLSPDAVRLRRELAGDLDTIVLTALRKQPANRYPSVESLAGDIRNHLESRPISAKPASRRYVAGKFVRRHRVGVTATAGACLALVAGAAMVVWSMLQAQAERDRAQIEALRAEQTSGFVINMLGSIDPDYAQGADTELIRRVLEDAAARAPVELAAQPSVLSDIHYVIGRAFALIGDRERGREHLMLAAELARDTPQTPRYLKPQISLARNYGFTGDYVGGLERIESVLALAAGLPPGDSLRLTALYIKAYLLIQLNETEAGEAIVHELVERTEGADEAVLVDLRFQALLLLAVVHMNYERFEESHRLYEQVRAEAAVWDDPAALNHIARALHDQALVYRHEQQYEQAESLLRECLALQEQRHGADHPVLIAGTGSLATTLLRQDRLDEARPLFERSLVMAREAYGPEQPFTLLIQNEFGNLLRRQGEVSAAVELQRVVVAAADAAFPPGHPLRGDLLRDLGRSELALGNAAAARELALEAVSRFTEAFGEEHDLVAEARETLVAAEEALDEQ